MESLLTSAVEYLSAAYIIAVILLSYIVINMIGYFKKDPSTNVKKTISFIIGIVIGVLYFYIDIITISAIIPSFCVALIGYDYAIKYLLAKLNITSVGSDISTSTKPPVE